MINVEKLFVVLCFITGLMCLYIINTYNHINALVLFFITIVIHYWYAASINNNWVGLIILLWYAGGITVLFYLMADETSSFYTNYKSRPSIILSNWSLFNGNLLSKDYLRCKKALRWVYLKIVYKTYRKCRNFIRLFTRNPLIQQHCCIAIFYLLMVYTYYMLKHSYLWRCTYGVRPPSYTIMKFKQYVLPVLQDIFTWQNLLQGYSYVSEYGQNFFYGHSVTSQKLTSAYDSTLVHVYHKSSPTDFFFHRFNKINLPAKPIDDSLETNSVNMWYNTPSYLSNYVDSSFLYTDLTNVYNSIVSNPSSLFLILFLLPLFLYLIYFICNYLSYRRK